MFIRVTSVRDDLIAESRRTVTDCTYCSDYCGAVLTEDSGHAEKHLWTRPVPT